MISESDRKALDSQFLLEGYTNRANHQLQQAINELRITTHGDYQTRLQDIRNMLARAELFFQQADLYAPSKRPQSPNP